MTFEDYYKEALPELKQMEQDLTELIKQYPAREDRDQIQPVLYCKSRIKSPDSMIRKLTLHHLPTDAATALENMHDAVGIRIICSFVSDVYDVAGWLHSRQELSVLKEKDYISYPKPNGYRSLHLIVKPASEEQNRLAEIQIRTIALDFWAALEHQLKYKQHVPYEKTIHDELKRCADEIASVDLSMQALRDFITSAGTGSGSGSASPRQ